MSVDRVLLTNDDGIDTVGFRALYDALADAYDVVAVAPAEDQSSVGRSLSGDVTVHDHELGFAVEGTPADCVVAGLGELVADADVVVSGCNKGANLGAYVLGRSGTVSAAVEATFFDVPALAASVYVPGGDDWWKRDLSPANYRNATAATRYLVDHAVDAGVFEHADYLNVNAPLFEDSEGFDAPAEAVASIEVTEPSTLYEMDAERGENGDVVLHDRIWDHMRAGDIPDPEGTDRRAVVEGRVSVSPLTAPHTVSHHEALDGLAQTYDGTRVLTGD
ncbi:5'/3'-nucleotidase SurE [Haloparvum sedimenti]|uniref:5'/3'-nucleotidase SurE n=1 Tax=Haloparvum sedimenti TaxID=1678448 RepID=UPI00071E8FF5|nr:5'/3'-nucleotidase SurE [Haloparvum sedimenti]